MENCTSKVLGGSHEEGPVAALERIRLAPRRIGLKFCEVFSDQANAGSSRKWSADVVKGSASVNEIFNKSV